MNDVLPCTLEDGTVVNVTVKYDSKLMKLIKSITGMEGLTVWNTIRYFCPKDQLNSTTLKHEMQHVRQWHRLGRVKFFFQYYLELIRHGYAKNSFEQEARQVAGESLR